MKQFLQYIIGWFDDFIGQISNMPTIRRGIIPVLIAFSLIILWPTLRKVIGSGVKTEILDIIIITIIFLCFGILGILFIVYKEAPLFFVLVKGVPAVAIGLLLSIGSFTIIIWGLIVNLSRFLKY